MKLAAIFTVVGAFIQLVQAYGKPRLQFDPNTIKSCIFWYDHDDHTTCEAIRSKWNLSPETFHLWNPSITLDCQNWKYWSYCVAIADETPTSTASTTLSTTQASTAAPPRKTADLWTDRGCYDILDQFPLDKHYLALSGSQLTRANCEAACWQDKFRLVGLQGGTECWCSNSLIALPSTDQTSCNVPCAGNKTEICGSSSTSKFNILEGSVVFPPDPSSTTTAQPTADPTTSLIPLPTASSGWSSLGCYKDTFPSNSRTLRNQVSTDGDLTIDSCRTLCSTKGYSYSGVEDGRECWCDDSIQSPSSNSEVALSDCNKPCPGDATQQCGAGARIFLSTHRVEAKPKWTSVACYKDTFPDHARTLADQVSIDGDLTVESCQSQCLAKKYVFSGVEDGRECWCGNILQSPSTNVYAPSSECNKPCPANRTETCGASGRIFISRYDDPLKSKWDALGCWKDTFPTNDRTLSTLVSTDGDLSVESCRNLCLARNYVFSGVEDGRECWCGNEIQARSKSFPDVAEKCDKPCPGNKKENCGAGGHLNLSKYTASNTIWIPMGCYKEESPRVLRNQVSIIGGVNAQKTCIFACEQAGYSVAGVENGNECWCDNVINAPGKPAPDGAAGW